MSEENASDKDQDKENPYLNNPLHGVGLKTVLQEIVSHYGFDILYAYLNINCFRKNPSLEGSEKFLKKTDWARQKVEIFYLYQFKNLPAVSSEQFKLPPRERIVPEHRKRSEPAVLSIEDGERLQEKRATKVANRNSSRGPSKKYNERRNAGYSGAHGQSSERTRDDSSKSQPAPPKDPWGNFKGKK